MLLYKSKSLLNNRRLAFLSTTATFYFFFTVKIKFVMYLDNIVLI